MAVKKTTRKDESLKKQCNNVIKKLEVQLQKKRTTIANIAAYLAVSIARAPKRVKSAPPKKVTASSRHYFTVPTQLFYPDKNNPKGYRDAGVSMADYLKKIKGGYRATGAGSYMKEKVQTRVKGSHPPGTYAEKNQRPGEFFVKGTGKISETERRRLQEYQEQERRLHAQLLAPDRRKNAKDQARMQAKLRKIQERKAAITSMSEKRKARFLQQEAKARSDFQARVESRRQKRLERIKKFREEKVLYRIVKTTRREVADPQAATVLRKGAEPGKVPFSWPRSGKGNYYISQWSDGVSENGKTRWVSNYQVRQVGDWSYQVSIQPLGGRTSYALRRLEYGGDRTSTPYVIGYLVNTRDVKGGHRRVSFSPVYSDSKTVRVEPRPWVSPTVAKVQEYVRKRNGKDIRLS
ncbi:MAG: hypothetical protein Q4D98_03035 [Planctomycetia bacterium]|nr:hypothetical protein [Planctomycetia bacterium]